MDNWMLEHIHQGMTVYDANGYRIGTVKSVFLGGRPDHDPTLPKSLENRLRREGFIVVDRPMARDPYIFPDQIAMVSGEDITLQAEVDELFVP
ncbi:MAG: hypothetical protein KJ064_08770 [Anaerolineae bacterium]|nr:hypothetical protein [Anaerolineae bacterium]